MSAVPREPERRRDLRRLSTILVAAWLVAFSCPAFALGAGETAAPMQLEEFHSGDTVSLQEFAGRVVYLDFWASWCGPCLKSMPFYEELYTRLGGENFEIIGVNLDENPDDAARFLEEHPVSFTVLLDPSGEAAGAWKIPALPSSYLIGPGQQIVRSWSGFRESHREEIEREIRAMLEN
jgi:cytochrome c biogenesis protein CcmG/thiol:disulfide interchange protein DsbE